MAMWFFTFYPHPVSSTSCHMWYVYDLSSNPKGHPQYGYIYTLFPDLWGLHVMSSIAWPLIPDPRYGCIRYVLHIYDKSTMQCFTLFLHSGSSSCHITSNTDPQYVYINYVYILYIYDPFSEREPWCVTYVKIQCDFSLSVHIQGVRHVASPQTQTLSMCTLIMYNFYRSIC